VPDHRRIHLKARRKSTTWFIWIAIVLGLGLIALLGWVNYRYAAENPGGNDFVVHWIGTRSFLYDGLSPYSDETSERIQRFVYGRPARPGEHELRVAYPLYSVMLFLPFALIKNFIWARAIWMTVLEIGLAATALLAARLARWRPGMWLLILYLLFSLVWYHAVRPLINGNAVILVILALVGALLAIRTRQDEIAGMLLALTTIKPQLVVLVLVFIVIWAMAHRRWKIISWLAASVFILSAFAALFLPDWLWQNLREVVRYPGYNPPGTVAAAFAEFWPGFGRTMGWIFSGVFSLILLVEWILHRKADFRGFLWTICLTLVLGGWVGIQNDPGNFIMMVPALPLIFAGLAARWQKASLSLIIGSLILLLVGVWAIFLGTVEYAYQPIQSPVMFFPLPAFLLLMLYWVRWWTIRSSSTWIDRSYEEELA